MASSILPNRNSLLSNDTIEYQTCVVPSSNGNGISPQNEHSMQPDTNQGGEEFHDESFYNPEPSKPIGTIVVDGEYGEMKFKDNAKDSITIIKYAKSDLKEIMRSMDYVLLIIWFSVQVLPSQYYIGIVGYQLEHRGHDGLWDIFPYVMALSALTAPVIGIIADNYGIAQMHVCATTFPSISLLILSSSSKSWHMFGFFIFAMGRIMVFSSFYIHIGKLYQYTHYGTLVGTGFIISSIVSLFQYPLLSKASSGRENLVNYTLAFALIFQGLPYCFWVHEQNRREDTQSLEKENKI